MHLSERWWSVCRALAWGHWMCMLTPDGVAVRASDRGCLRYPTCRVNALGLSCKSVCVSAALTKSLW